MELVGAVLLLAAVFAFVIGVRSKDLPAVDPVSPTAHLDEKKARIYEGLRDLQFEYRVGKLSDEDYQHTKLDLQKELAAVMAEIDKLAPKKPAAERPVPPQKPAHLCPHCGAKFDKPMKFCGECGKAMEAKA